MLNSAKGFSLIEVLVSLVILLIGLIGIFNLHIVAKQGSFESFQQTQATYYIHTIISRMRLNNSELSNYAGTYTGSSVSSAKSCDVAIGVVDLCTTAETRAWDLYQWVRSFEGVNEKSASGVNIGGLDSVTACIRVDGVSVLVVISWRGVRVTSDGAADDADTFVSGCGAANDRRRSLAINTVII
ncbi:type IV pilus modification protein PilV [Shewanella sp. SR44-3]|uniref:type IV pilus modification protein PilV n=1 Tax=Shewanella sp. SR44-3 TaxID=2760936 RepID=UPI0015F97EC3|nr:type IV pilus modification protein PilV [Shewanella sp. SR44-3]MBB1269241.1 type IV pilus modification protein PilV [Shewanella sp. SR44-3]